MNMSKYRNFGFVPEEFKCSIEKNPGSANANILAKWYNRAVDKLNEAVESKLIDNSRPSYWRNSGNTYSEEQKKYLPISVSDVQNMKSKKTDSPYFFREVYEYVYKYELEKFLQEQPEYEDFRQVVINLEGLRGHLHSKVSGPSGLSISDLNWFDIKNIKNSTKSYTTFTFTFQEGFGSYGWRDYEGEHNGWFNIRWEGGQFVFPVKDDPLCWDGHEVINSGFSRKSHARLGMSGAATRTKRMGHLTAKYLNESGLPKLVKKYLLKEDASRVIPAEMPKVLNPKEYGFDGWNWSVMENIRIVGYCRPEAKDSMRMRKLVDTNKEGESVAAKITDKYKAARRYVAGLKIKNLVPTLNETRTAFTGAFACFGNRALELGVPGEAIIKACK